ncbi:MAG: TonB-dependent receptor [Chitinophagaceae bacterium]|nr:MAG: TonB-dependent receptor [Chitinophagaceae bacterium]
MFGQLPSKIDIYTAKIDYTKPLGKSLKFESGYKYSSVETDNLADYYTMVNGVKYSDNEKTNRFAYEEFIHAGYINMNKEWKKWSVQAGLRVEHTNYAGHQYGNPVQPDSAFKVSYTSAFPTLYIGYKATQNHNFNMSYGRRINRPDYEDLNPFLFFIDKYTYGSGNPYMKPMFSDVAEFSHTYKNWLTTTLNYSYTQDLFNEIFEERGYATLLKKGNFGRSHNSSLSVNAMLNIKKWWKSNVYVEGRYLDFTGTVAGEAVKSFGGTYLMHAQNNFTFKKGWGAELSGVYRSSAVEGQMRIKSIGQLNLGVQKQVLKNKGVIKFNVRDVFLTMRPKGNIDFQRTRASFRQTNESRVATISFQYRFGKPIKGIPKRKTGGSSEEQSRVKGSAS